MKKLVCLLPLLFTLFHSHAQSDSTTNAVPFIKGFRLETENDVFFPVHNRDRNYTGQFKFEFFVTRIFDKGFFIPFIRNKKFHNNNLQSFFFHGMGYTPSREAFSSTAPVVGERPFASYICGGYERTAWWSSDTERWKNFSMTTEFTLGKIGSSAAGKVQNFIHEYITVASKPVLGWDNQIGHPGRFAFYYRINGAWMPFQFKPKDIFLANVGLRYDVMPVGFFMQYAKLGLSISNQDIGALAKAPDIASIRFRNISFFKPHESKEVKFKVGFEFFPSIKRVFWNTMLQGHPIEDASIYKIESADIKKWVSEASFRLKFQFDNERDNRIFTLFYNANVRGKEFTNGDHIHFWGTLGFQTMKK
jgi:hypothetical protein